MPILWLVILRSASGAREFYYALSWQDALRVFGEQIGKDGTLYARIRPAGKEPGSWDENLAMLRTLAAEGFPRFEGSDAWPAWIVALPVQKRVPVGYLTGGTPHEVQADESWWASCVGGVVVDFQRGRDGARTVARNGHRAGQLQQSFDANRTWVIVRDRAGQYQIGRGNTHYAEQPDLEQSLAYVNRHSKPEERVILVDLEKDRICSLRPRMECPPEEKISPDAPRTVPASTPASPAPVGASRTAGAPPPF